MRKRIKRIGAIVLGFIVALGTKVFGVDSSDTLDLNYIFRATEPVPLYGVEPPILRLSPVLKILAITIIPIILIIGLFIYTKRNKNSYSNSKKVKIAKIIYRVLLILVALLITAACVVKILIDLSYIIVA